MTQEKQHDEELVDVNEVECGVVDTEFVSETTESEDGLSFMDNLDSNFLSDYMGLLSDNASPEDAQDAIKMYSSLMESLLSGSGMEITTEPVIVEYITDPKLVRINPADRKSGGCLLAVCRDGVIHVGYAFRNTKLDVYDKYYGNALASQRLGFLADSTYISDRIPYRYRPILAQFIHRAQRYFGHDKALPDWVIGFMSDGEVIENTVKYMLKRENLAPYVDKFKKYVDSI